MKMADPTDRSKLMDILAKVDFHTNLTSVEEMK